jgi:hypothetical protein
MIQASHFQTHKWSWNKQKFGHGFRKGAKARETVLARTRYTYENVNITPIEINDRCVEPTNEKAGYILVTK